MYDLTQFSGDGYYAVGGDSPIDKVKTMAVANINIVLALIVVLVILVVALFFGYIAPRKEGLISGSMASLGIGGSQRSDYGTPGDMVIVPNYSSAEGFDGEVSEQSKAARVARDLSVMSPNQAAAVIAGQPCNKSILTTDDAYAWMGQVARENYAQPNDAQLTASMKGY